MRLPIDIILQEVIEEYDFMYNVKNGFVVCEIRRGMYGFTQVGILANKLLGTWIYCGSQLPPLKIHSRTLKAR